MEGGREGRDTGKGGRWEEQVGNRAETGPSTKVLAWDNKQEQLALGRKKSLVLRAAIDRQEGEGKPLAPGAKKLEQKKTVER